MTTSFYAINNPDGTTSIAVTIDNGDGSFTSMSKETYDSQRTDTPDQAELDAIAKAQADAKTQADAEKAQALADKTIRDSGIAKAVLLGFTQTQAEGMFP